MHSCHTDYLSYKSSRVNLLINYKPLLRPARKYLVVSEYDMFTREALAHEGQFVFAYALGELANQV